MWPNRTLPWLKSGWRLFLSSLDYYVVPFQGTYLNNTINNINALNHNDHNALNKYMTTSETSEIKLTTFQRTESILNAIINNGLKIDIAFIKFIQLFQDMINNEKYNENKYKMYGQFIVYFVICIIFEKSNKWLITKKIKHLNENNPPNKFLDFLLIYFFQNLQSHHISFESYSHKTKEMNKCLSLHLDDKNNDICELIFEFADFEMFSFLQFVINFMHSCQEKCYIHHSMKHVCNFLSDDDRIIIAEIIELNTVPLIIFEICKDNKLFQHENEYNELVLLFTSKIVLSLLYSKRDEASYGRGRNISLLMNKYHPFPFFKFPQFWMDLLKMHFELNDSSNPCADIHNFFTSVCFARTEYPYPPKYNENIGTYLFYPFGKDCGYNDYLSQEIDYEQHAPNYDYIYNQIVCVYFLNDKSSGLYLLNWFLRDCIKYFLTLWIYQHRLNNYNKNALCEFISFMLKCIDNKDIICKMKRLYPDYKHSLWARYTRSYYLKWNSISYYLEFSRWNFTINEFFGLIEGTFYSQTDARFQDLQDLVKFIHTTGWGCN